MKIIKTNYQDKLSSNINNTTKIIMLEIFYNGYGEVSDFKLYNKDEIELCFYSEHKKD